MTSCSFEFPSCHYSMWGAVLFDLWLSSMQQPTHSYPVPDMFLVPFCVLTIRALSKISPWLPEVCIFAGRSQRMVPLLVAWAWEPLWNGRAWEIWVWAKNKSQVRLHLGFSQNLQGDPCTCWLVIERCNRHGVALEESHIRHVCAFHSRTRSFRSILNTEMLSCLTVTLRGFLWILMGE